MSMGQDPGGAAPDRGTLDQARADARRRVAAKRAFTQHLFSYLVVNAVLVAIWFFTGRGSFWPGWVMGFWGLGLVMHGWNVYGRRPITEADVEAEMKRSGEA